jgi:hypothetical protein
VSRLGNNSIILKIKTSILICRGFFYIFTKNYLMACAQYTLLQYQTLSDAIVSGALEVQYGDKTVKYRSLDEMIRIQAMMKNCLFPEQNTNNGRKYASFSKGTNNCR